jgi:hypothetical protein
MRFALSAEEVGHPPRHQTLCFFHPLSRGHSHVRNMGDWHWVPEPLQLAVALYLKTNGHRRRCAVPCLTFTADRLPWGHSC